MITSDKIELVAAALVAAQKEMGNATKDSNNPFFKSKYADLIAIREAILPVTTKHDLTVLQLPAVQDGKNYIQTVVMHSSGQFLSSMDEVVCSKQNDPQSKLAAQTYTRRGSLQAFFNIGCEDDDGQTASGKPSNQAQSSKSTSPSQPVQAVKPSTGGFGSPAKAVEVKAEAVKEEVKPVTKAPARSGSFGM
jgi:hypothetical protein